MTLLRVILKFFQFGSLSFGGNSSLYAMIKKDFVDRNQMLQNDDLTEAITYASLLPGPASVSVVTYISMRLEGWIGAVLATIAYIIPSFLLMIGLSIAYTYALTVPGIEEATRGLTAAVAGLLGATCYQLGRPRLKRKIGLFIALIAFFAMLLFNIPIYYIIIGAGLSHIMIDLFSSYQADS